MSSVIKAKTKFLLTILLCLSLILFPLVSLAINPEQVANPQATNGMWVNDMANILSDRTESQLNVIIDELEQKNGTEIAVVTVPDTQPASSPKQFTTELFNLWKIGKAGQDNGLLFLVSVGDRRVEIETGYGVEGVLPDAKVGNIIQNLVTPRFKQGDFDGGVLDGTQALVKVLSGEEFVSPPIIKTKKNLISPLEHHFDWLPAVIGLLGCFYYYRTTINRIKPIYLSPIGYSRNRYLNYFSTWKIYALVYLGSVCICLLTLVPLLASLSHELLIAALVGLYIWYAIALKQNPSPLKVFLEALLYPPVGLALVCFMMLYFSALGVPLVMIVILDIVYRFKRDLDLGAVGPLIELAGSLTVNCVFLLGITFCLTDLLVDNNAYRQIVIYSLLASVPLTYFVWNYLKEKYQYSLQRQVGQYLGGAKVFCLNCSHPLKLLENRELEPYLRSPEKVAQKLGSVSFRGWQCPSCKGEKSEAHICADVVAVMGRKYSKCPTCKEITVVCTSEILKQATTTHAGIRLRNYTCQCCDYNDQKEITIPRKSSSSKRISSSSSSSSYYSSSSFDSSSSSSSSSSDFGGGESGGGGAGDSW